MLDTNATTAALQPEPVAGYTFGRFMLHRRERLLLADGMPIELGSRAVEVLLALVGADGALLTKSALLDRVWPGVVVEENNLQVQISALRRVLGPDRDWIATVPGRGYRFTGPVEALADEKTTTPAAATRLPAETEPPRLSIIVLPFANRGDPAEEWFADAVTDSLTTDLARMLPPGSGSTVVSQTTADAYRGHHGVDVRAIGREQGVRYVLEGSVLLADDWVRVNAQLVAADTDAHLWSDRFDKPRHDVLQVQDEIVGRLTRSVAREMIDAEARRAEQAEHEHLDENADMAQDYVLRAHAAASQRMMTRDGSETACALYASALARAPDCADALAGIASVRIYQVVNGYFDETGRTVRDEGPVRERYLAEAEEKLGRALVIAPGHLAALKNRAVMLRARGLFADALAAADAVLARNPGDPAVHRETGLNLLYLGRTEDAVDRFRHADALAVGDPARWTWLQGLGRALMQLGRDAEAADALRLAVISNPSFATGHALLAAALALAGEDASALAAMTEFRRVDPETTVETLARRSAVPFEATDPLYKSRNERVLDGLRRAAGLAP